MVRKHRGWLWNIIWRTPKRNETSERDWVEDGELRGIKGKKRRERKKRWAFLFEKNGV